MTDMAGTWPWRLIRQYRLRDALAQDHTTAWACFEAPGQPFVYVCKVNGVSVAEFGWGYDNVDQVLDLETANRFVLHAFPNMVPSHTMPTWPVRWEKLLGKKPNTVQLLENLNGTQSKD